ncbi:battenin CLN3 protein [Tieghemiomyces parasiticus]|uniref:Protein BTN n=1 Tax=Tieghemiomyces parasiticus TaxID=78921 RepID=A0A9W8A7F5_9FUNG|nr:battenin CLN3 protein [Tieghemiomyces parasiticus]
MAEFADRRPRPPSPAEYPDPHLASSDDEADSGPAASAFACSPGILVAFFFSGLINNYVYTVFLSAAVDILEASPGTPKGVVLLADIMPSLMMKLVAPYYIHHVGYGTRVAVCSLASFAALHIVATFDALPLRLCGVILASAASGLGELSFLMLTSYFAPTVVSAWASGTGGAGVTGSLSFLAFTTWFGLSTPTTLRTVSILPPLILLFYHQFLRAPLNARLGVPSGAWRDHRWLGRLRATWLGRYIPAPLHTRYEAVLPDRARASVDIEHADALFLHEDHLAAFVPPGLTTPPKPRPVTDDDKPLPARYAHLPPIPVSDMTLAQRLRVVRPLLPIYILPLLVVYWAEYTINQGVNPTVLFPLSDSRFYPFHRLKDHYVYYQALYQIGVFISRSSVHYFPVRHLWYPSGLQVIMLAVMISQSLGSWLPSVWWVFALIFIEGLLGGSTYVNAFLNIRQDVPVNYREFALGAVGVGDGIGITLAGLTALWLEPSLCWFQQRHGNDLCSQL